MDKIQKIFHGKSENNGAGSEDMPGREAAAGVHKPEHESSGPLHKLKEKLHDAKVELIHAKAKVGKFGNIVNPNHRHDEEHEKIIDEKRSNIAKEHRFESFAPIRKGNQLKFYVDGRDYFWAVSKAIERAEHVIYIADWWLSPELFLRRPPAYSEEDRIDRMLKRRAEAGVKIYVCVYKEVDRALTCNSAHTKHALERLCPEGQPGHGNIIIMRHPDHNFFENAGDMTFYWAHHEKFVIVDYEVAFIGGLDLCFGRWDLRQHPLADIHPGNVTKEIWPGQDYNNNRIMDFHNVIEWEQNELDKTQYGRMPWHDVSVGLRGNAILDIAEHFVGRWNMVKRDKYRRDEEYDWLQLTYRDNDIIGCKEEKHPKGEYVKHPPKPYSEDEKGRMGSVNAQLVRSSADWSHGILTEHSIQNAYKELIRNAQHYVYIENQFFITATGDKQAPITNTIGEAIVEAVVRADKEGRKFRVIVLMPSIPGFAGDLREKAANGTRAIMDYQYKSICRGEESIFGKVKAAGVDPEKYLFFFNLRTFDRLNKTQRITEIEKETGVLYHEVQKAKAAELQTMEGDGQEDKNDPEAKKKAEEAADRRAKYEAAQAEKGDEKPVSKDTIAEDALQSGKNVSEEIWGGDNDSERSNYVSEQLYIHAKVLIVDDQFAVIGSSNLNDRSQLGYHDSELSIVLEDEEKIDIEMDGKPAKVSKFVANLRRQLWREHLGLMPPQPLDASKDPNAQPPGEGENDLYPNEEAKVVNDPLHDAVWNRWISSATENTKIFRELFHCVPDDNVRTFEEYDAFLPQKGVKTGHLYNPFGPVDDVKRRLDDVRGHLVWLPMLFLDKETMAERDMQVNDMTESIFT